jgi:phosphopentomutase
VPLEELYRVCEIARRHCNEYHIGRVIARPFEGELGSFYRTYERHDYAMPPHSPTVLDHASGAGLAVLGIGKIEDLFAGQGLTEAVHTEGDADGLDKTLDALDENRRGIIFTNLVDLDMRYGHRENAEGYAAGLALIDSYLPRLTARLTDRDLLFFSADHGNDPTDGSTDHTREYVPLLAHARAAAGVALGIRSQYSDVAATIADALHLTPPNRGVSFLAEIT